MPTRAPRAPCRRWATAQRGACAPCGVDACALCQRLPPEPSAAHAHERAAHQHEETVGAHRCAEVEPVGGAHPERILSGRHHRPIALLHRACLLCLHAKIYIGVKGVFVTLKGFDVSLPTKEITEISQIMRSKSLKLCVCGSFRGGTNASCQWAQASMP